MCPLLAQQTQNSGTESQETASYTILYTGRTLGYYRVPDQQTISSRACSGRDATLAQVTSFLDAVRAVPGPKVLIGMGDNFSPELNARTMLDDKSKQLVPKDQLVWDFSRDRWVRYTATSPELDSALSTGAGTAGFDNVACFLRLAGFDGVVPGREDFRFGPQRLRELARYLASDAPGGTPVQMLGANLIINTISVKPVRAARANVVTPRNYSLTGQNRSFFRIPPIPLPWLRRFDVINGRPQDAGPLYNFAWLCGGPQESEVDPDQCEALVSTGTSAERTTLSFSLPTEFPRYPAQGSLQPSRDYFVCASSTNKTSEMTAGNTFCSPVFRFHQPFFHYGVASDPNPKPYVRIGNQPLVVFGIVDPALLPRIGEMNYSWVNEDAGLDTQVEIIDPREALRQLLETCDADPDCRGARRILLAQMPLEDVRRLSDRLQGEFDAIISASDEAHATRDTLTVDRNVAPDTRAPIVLTPAAHFVRSSPSTLQVTIQNARLELTSTTTSADSHFHRKTVPLRLRGYTGQRSLADVIVNATAERNRASVTQNPITLIESAVLRSMLERCHADIAFLQHRDLFRPEYFAKTQPAADELQTMLDELLWKGDFLVCRAATGAVIRQVLARSDAYEAGEDDGAEIDRSLARLGIFRDNATGDLIVGGSVLQDAELYSGATTDFVGLGDTGYAAFRQVPVPPAVRVRDYEKLDEISALVCQDLIRGIPGSGAGPESCRLTIDTTSYFDEIKVRPYPEAVSAGAFHSFREWIGRNWASRGRYPRPPNAAEAAAQNRRLVSLRLDRANIGFRHNYHSLTEAQQRERFSGVQASQPTAPERIDATADWLLRLTARGREADLFLQTDAAYQASAIRQTFTSSTTQGTVTIEPFQLSQPRNLVGVEGGATWHLIPLHQKSAAGLRLLTSVRFETELASPLVAFQAKDGFLPRPLPRRNAFFGKGGLRYDGRQSWVETGIQSGPFNQITSLTLGALTCTPGNIAACVAPPGAELPGVVDLDTRPLAVQTLRRNQSGVFLNARIHLPLSNRLDYTIDNSGALFFNLGGDSPADTRYLEVMTHALTIPILGNLSIAPRLDLFFFQNKVAGWRIYGYQTSITAQYRFDWHTGLPFRSALKYPAAR